MNGRALLPVLLPLAVLLAWTALSGSGLAPAYLLPGPAAVFEAGVRYVFAAPGQGPYAGRFFTDLLASLGRVFAGFGLAALLGVPLGLCSGRVVTVNRLFASTIGGLRAVPGICWLPLALIWFGIGFRTTVFLVALAAFFPIYQNALTGARSVAPIYYQAGAMLGVSRLRGVFAILLPLAMPNLLTGLRLGMGISWAYLVLGELTGVPDGLGAVIMDARMLGQTDMILVGILLIALVGRLCDRLLVGLLRVCSKSARRLG
ncbi:ABC transporter permease [uncultured Desulfobulbus sp.]|uniref:ABC transporter permease n=1 Tax=uncultured Desulfobulbus sp. TaxID=239745 RepID=UPI00260DD344|nr:ABC transporter permease [uncultured Desulfobulbus sp.]